MANKKIPIKDIQLVTQRLAEGMSTRQAIDGTSISSNSTAARLASSQSNEIAQKREDYLQLIMEEADLTYIERARMWGQMLNAKKYIPVTDATNAWSSVPPHMRATGGYISVPDWNVIYKAMVYLDRLSGLHGPSINIGDNSTNYTQIIKEQKIKYGT